MLKNWIESVAARVSRFNRARKYLYFLERLRPTASDRILDVGFANHEGERNDMINYLEKHYLYPERITALGVDGKDVFERRYPKVRAVLYDGREFPFADQSFDIGWSNAVIEHVGDRSRQVLFVRELLRTCRRVYFTTPNRYFPVELHTKLPFCIGCPPSGSTGWSADGECRGRRATVCGSSLVGRFGKFVMRRAHGKFRSKGIVFSVS